MGYLNDFTVIFLFYKLTTSKINNKFEKLWKELIYWLGEYLKQYLAFNVTLHAYI